MNNPTISPPPRAEPPGTLDERIALAEQRLVVRERALQQAGQALKQRLRQATEPRRLVWPALGGMLVLLVAFWGLRRKASGGVHGAAPAPANAGVAAPGFGDLPWMRAAGLLWPLLPAAWRGWISPGTASVLLALGLPLADWLFRRRQRPVPAERA